MTDRKRLRVQEYIAHIIDAISRIESYVKDLNVEAFIENNLVQDAVIRNFDIIGEAANNIKLADETFTQRHPRLLLDEAYKMRNAMAHGYYLINLIIV